MNETIVLIAIGVPFVALVCWMGRRLVLALIVIAAGLDERWRK